MLLREEKMLQTWMTSSTPTHPISKDQCLQLQVLPFGSISIQDEEEKEGWEREGC